MIRSLGSFLLAAALLSGCGSSKPSSALNGTYSGRLSGISCTDGSELSVAVSHHVEADGDEEGDAVELIDSAGNVYRGRVVLYVGTGGEGFYGFSLGTSEEDETLATFITYNFFTRPEGEPDVVMHFRRSVPESTDTTCEYDLTGRLAKVRPD